MNIFCFVILSLFCSILNTSRYCSIHIFIVSKSCLERAFFTLKRIIVLRTLHACALIWCVRGVRGGEILRTNGEEFAVFQRERDSVLCTQPHIMSIIIISIVKSNKMLIRRYTQLQEMDMVNVVTKLLKEGMVIIVI